MDTNLLSERELEILRLVATGASNKEIAQKLVISPNTVKVHLRNIFSKTGVVSRTEAAMYAIQMGLIVSKNSPLTNLAAEIPNLSLDIQKEITSQPDTKLEDQSLDSISTLNKPKSFSIKTSIIRRIPLFAIAISILALISILLPIWIEEKQTNTGLANENSRWSKLADMPTARTGLAVVTYENQIYAIGGLSPQGITGANERFNPETNEWIQLSQKPLPVTDIQAAVIGGVIYIPGGRTSDNHIVNTFEVYEPQSDQWSNLAPLPKNLSSYALAAYEGHIFIFGGWDGNSYVNYVFEYDPSRNLWIEHYPMDKARGLMGALVVRDRVHLLGGYDGQNALVNNDVFLPDYAASNIPSWRQESPLADARYNMGTTDVADILYVLGGQGADAPLESYEFLSTSGNWQVIERPYINSWTGMGMVSLGSYIYAIGGTFDNNISARCQSYQAIYTVFSPISK